MGLVAKKRCFKTLSYYWLYVQNSCQLQV